MQWSNKKINIELVLWLKYISQFAVKSVVSFTVFLWLEVREKLLVRFIYIIMYKNTEHCLIILQINRTFLNEYFGVFIKGHY